MKTETKPENNPIWFGLQEHCKTDGKISCHTCPQRLGAPVRPLAENEQVLFSRSYTFWGPWDGPEVSFKFKDCTVFSKPYIWWNYALGFFISKAEHVVS